MFAVAMGPDYVSRTSFTGGGNLAVFEDTESRDASWKFVRWLSQPETQIQWYEISTDLPSVQAAFDDHVFADDPYLSVFAEQLEDSKAPPPIPPWAPVSSVNDQELEKVPRGDNAPKKASAPTQPHA